MMKIVVLDGYTLNPGDLSWNGLESLGKCEIYDRSSPAEVLKRAGGAEIVLVNKIVLSREAIFSLPRLKYIGVTATGYNIVDVVAARERGITVTNVPSYGTRSVAQMTFALLLELTQRVGHHAQTVRDGRWTACPDFCYWDYPLLELDGLTMGIVGFGRIGRSVANLAAAFGMNVLAHSRSQGQEQQLPLPVRNERGEGRPIADTQVSHQHNDPPLPGPLLPREEREKPSAHSGMVQAAVSSVTGAGFPPALVKRVDLETLFRQSDVISLHCPLTPETKHLVNVERLSWVKSSALLLNTSRGALIDEPALAEALNSNRIAGAGLDVLGIEPPPANHPLLHVRNCLITPHIAWATRAARSRLLAIAIANVKTFLDGKPQNVVS